MKNTTLSLLVLLTFNGFSQSFGPEKEISESASLPVDIRPADIDGDGYLDIVSLTGDDNKLVWYKNDGTGEFGHQQVISKHDNHLFGAVNTSDLDGDGDTDLISIGAEGLKTYRNDGQGSFNEWNVISSNLILSVALDVSDLDGDGNLDILFGSLTENKVAWFRNIGSGNFSSENSIVENMPDVRGIKTADIDQDGDLDLVAFSGADSKLAWFENDGQGNFGSENIIGFGTTNSISYDLNLIDLDDDGDLDLLTNAAWYENDGLGVFIENSQENSEIAEGYRIKALDADNDGDLDFVSFHSDHVKLYENTGSLVFEEGIQINSIQNAGNSEYYSLGSIHILDVNYDGKLDFVLLSSFEDKIAWYGNDGFGDFNDEHVVTRSISEVSCIHSVDLDGDGDQDVLSSSFNDNKIAWYDNDGDGNFSIQKIISTNAKGASCVFSADLNGDGMIDVISSSELDNKITWYANNGFGDFEEQSAISTNALGAKSVSAGDFDNDGDMDIISGSNIDQKLAWFTNDGEGNFSDEIIIHSGSELRNDILVVDMDGDADADILTTVGNQIAWFENDGYGTFGTLQELGPTYFPVTNARTTDSNGDGLPEILSIGKLVGGTSITDNLGSGVFGPLSAFHETDHDVDLASGDVDNDGDLDLVFATTAPQILNTNALVWFENDGEGNYSSFQTIAVPNYTPFSVILADVDGDGDLDPISTSLYSDEITWYENISTGEGCTLENACNYNPEALENNNLCLFIEDVCQLTENTQTGQIGIISSDCECVANYLGDFNQDFAITSLDLSAFLSAFGTSAEENPFADLNEDGSVTSIDLSQFLVLFGTIFE